MKKNPIATIAMENGANIIIELYPQEAPNTVNAFVHVAKQEGFNNRPIRRIVKDFVLQPTYNAFEKDPICDIMLNGEFRANGIENNIKLDKWSVAMGGDGKTVASGSCFFITIGDCMNKLDGKYAGFGRVIAGFEEVERIVNVETKSIDLGVPGVTVNEPVIPEVMKTITVETFGAVYPEPDILDRKDTM